jgi:hypothetical protein
MDKFALLLLLAGATTAAGERQALRQHAQAQGHRKAGPEAP